MEGWQFFYFNLLQENVSFSVPKILLHSIDDMPVQNTLAARLFMPATLELITVLDKNN